ncbi:hypothetical protein [Methylocystis sp.]|uniref:hypothetical protein n=1 Tax=Methylocystis sp. TaxID=1911079 RepID=UPI0025EBFA07|nr:hypothetical protein [Methylocystis sp.]
MKPDALLTSDGHYDRSAIMTDAHRQRRLMARHGWTWSRCLRFSWTKARVMRERLNTASNKPVRALVSPTPEGVDALYMAITGRNVSAADMVRLADRMASLSN